MDLIAQLARELDLKVTDVIACREIIVMEAFIKGFRYGKIFVSLTCNQRGFILVCADMDQHRIAALQAVIDAIDSRRTPSLHRLRIAAPVRTGTLLHP